MFFRRTQRVGRLVFLLLLTIILCAPIILFKSQIFHEYVDAFILNRLVKNSDFKVHIGDFRNDFSKQITIEDISLSGPEAGDDPFFKCEKIIIHKGLFDLIFNMSRHVKIEIDKPHVVLSDVPQKFNLIPKDFINIEAIVKDGMLYANSKTNIAQDINGVISYIDDNIVIRHLNATSFAGTIEVRGFYSDFSSTVSHNHSYIESAFKHDEFDLELLFLRQPQMIKTYAQAKLSFLDTHVYTLDNGDIGFENNVLHLSNFYLEDRWRFDLKLDFPDKKYYGFLTWDENQIEAVMDLSDPAHYQFKFNLNPVTYHLLRFEGSVSVFGKVEINRDRFIEAFSGRISTEDFMINGNHYYDPEIFYEINKSEVNLLNIKLGPHINALGNISLNEPYQLDLKTAIKGLTLSQIFPEDLMQDFDVGALDGSFTIEGEMARPNIDGHLFSGGGRLQDVSFKSAQINLSGIYPILRIKDSKIHKDAGYLIPSGWIDFSLLGKENILKNAQINDSKDIFIFDGWKVTRNPAKEQVKFDRDIGDKFQVSLKTATKEKDFTIGPGPLNNKDTVEFRYKIADNENIWIKKDSEGDFFGLERKYTF